MKNNENSVNMNQGNEIDKEMLQGNKGITLLALIITIVIMLILTSVSINIATNQGVITNAKKAMELYSEAEIEEQINLVMTSYSISAYSNYNINYKEVVNDILDIFSYPHINEETGELENPDDATNDDYTITATNGFFSVVDKNGNLLVEIQYPIDNSETIQIKYNGTKYVYENFVLKTKETLVIEITGEETISGSNYIVGDWAFRKYDDGTLRIVGYNGTGEVDSKDSSILNLTVPNKINGARVSTLYLTSGTNIGKLNGTLTVSADITIERIQNFTNITKMVLKDNVSCSSWGGLSYSNSKITDLTLGTGVKLTNTMFYGTRVLQNVYLENNVTIGGRAFEGCKDLTEESINRILAKANISGIIFKSCTFTSPINIVIPENRNIKVAGLFDICSNINSITIKKGCTISSTNWNNGVFGITGEIAELIIEDNCTVNNLFYQATTTTIGKVIVKNNVTLRSRLISGVTTGNIEIGNNANISCEAFLESTGATKMVIGDNLNFSGSFYRAIDISTLEEIEIGNNATITGKLLQNMTGFKKATIGENAKLINYKNSGSSFGTFSAVPSVQEVIIGKGAEIGENAFLNCTSLQTVTLYLTDEQKADQSKIPTSWQAAVPNASFSGIYDESIGAYVWTVVYS